MQYAPVIHEPATPHVHHMILYTCDGVELRDVTDETLVGANCFSNNGTGIGTPLTQCTRGNLIAGWAVGGDVSYFSVYNMKPPYTIVYPKGYCLHIIHVTSDTYVCSLYLILWEIPQECITYDFDTLIG